MIRNNPEHMQGQSQHKLQKQLSAEQYSVGWLCALYLEMTAAEAMLDEVHQPLEISHLDSNSYILGSIAGHNVVIACLPADHYGTNNAASIARDMHRSFPSLQIRLMVGIGGGVPTSADIRLGDVVVGTTVGQYDFGKHVSNGGFRRTSVPTRPPQNLATAVSKLRAKHDAKPAKLNSSVKELVAGFDKLNKNYLYPGAAQDLLFLPSYDHDPRADDCERCKASQIIGRPPRATEEPKIHYGHIASGNSVIKSAKLRDEIAQESGALCFEMEAAGLVDHFPCLVIRGVCDYSDSHKSKGWQRYAAAVAASYAKDLLYTNPNPVTNPLTSPTMLRGLGEVVDSDKKLRTKLLINSLHFAQLDDRRMNIRTAAPSTCEWLLQQSTFREWRDISKYSDHHGFLWISGKAGIGKSTLMKYASTNAPRDSASYGAVISFFFNARGDKLEKSIVGMYQSLLVQLLTSFEKMVQNPQVEEKIMHLQRRDIDDPSRKEILSELFRDTVLLLGDQRVTCFIDALDECEESQARQMVADFEELGVYAARHNIPFFTCFSSRPYPGIILRHGHKLILEEQYGHREDLERYVDTKLKLFGDDNASTSIRQRIVDKSSGIFLWVILVVDILNKEIDRGFLHRIERRLNEIPPQLTLLFKEMLVKDNEDLDELLLCIQWILYSRRPLTINEFYMAMLSGTDLESPFLLLPLEDLNMENIRQFVLTCSKGLVEITTSENEIVQFIHESVRDFLIKDEGIYSIWPHLRNDDLVAMSHEKLKASCHQYIETHRLQVLQVSSAYTSCRKTWYETVSDANDFLHDFPFFAHCLTSVLYYANHAGKCITQTAFMHTFRESEWMLFCGLFTKASEDISTGESEDISASESDDDPAGLKRGLFDEPFVEFKGQEYEWICDTNYIYILAKQGYAEILLSITLPKQALATVVRGHYSSVLFVAMTNGHRQAVKALLQQNQFFPNREDISEKLPYGEDFEATFAKDCALADWASNTGNVDLIELLYRRGELNESDLADIDYPLWPELITSIKARNVEKARDILKSPQGRQLDLNRVDHQDRTLLFWLVKYGDERMLRILLIAGFTACNQIDKHGFTALGWACAHGRCDAISLLSRIGSDLLDPNIDSYDKIPPLARAAELGKDTVVKQLFKVPGVDVNRPGWGGSSPLSLAMVSGLFECVDVILSTPRLNVMLWDKAGEIPLHVAARLGLVDITKTLLDLAPSGAQHRNWGGWTPLHVACVHGSTEIVRCLLSEAASGVNSQTIAGATPLHLAVRYSHKDIVEVLLSIPSLDINLQDRRGWTALHHVASSDNEEIASQLLTWSSLNIHVADSDGRTPMKTCHQFSSNKVLDLLQFRDMGSTLSRLNMS